MLSAVSNISATAHQVAAGRAQPSRERTAAAAAALAALTPAQPLPSVAEPVDDGGFGFLYGPSGLPSGGPVPAQAIEPASRPSPARLAMESTELSALLSSLMAPEGAAPSSATADLAQAADTPQQSLITMLYRQF
ncbi:hypothetical protein [Mycoplana dimorpha]|uniref:Uncharacterized protein n=1 Tax=Mycoplana dimorpha TaxID=28320 RepID=A0A2T5BIB5_MYCDI|nr:hypothetical protein [Mycoplana dimorpha]PTM98719.1 hypothetical protein C7449_101385 [Mycoplana dimorpha]